MPLLDRFGREHTYLRVSVTDRCNLRCVYCMPAEGVHWKPRTEILTLEEIHRVCTLAVSQGITKIRLTGGEPTIRQNLISLIERLAALPRLQMLGMTTNGVTLHRQAVALRQAGLQGLNISIDTLDPQRFKAITGQDRLQDVLHGIDEALAIGFAPVKLNVVVMAGVNDSELVDFVEFARHRPLHIRFIEFMPFPGNSWNAETYLPWRSMKQRIEQRIPLSPLQSTGPVAKEFAAAGITGTVGFISPLSDEFCACCNRLRLTADGTVKSCLLYPSELSLRAALRSGADDQHILDLLKTALARKELSHPPEYILPQLENRGMTSTGG